jgi:hypothetical protein
LALTEHTDYAEEYAEGLVGSFRGFVCDFRGFCEKFKYPSALMEHTDDAEEYAEGLEGSFRGFVCGFSGFCEKFFCFQRKESGQRVDKARMLPEYSR